MSIVLYCVIMYRIVSYRVSYPMLYYMSYTVCVCVWLPIGRSSPGSSMAVHPISERCGGGQIFGTTSKTIEEKTLNLYCHDGFPPIIVAKLCQAPGGRTFLSIFSSTVFIFFFPIFNPLPLVCLSSRLVSSHARPLPSLPSSLEFSTSILLLPIFILLK